MYILVVIVVYNRHHRLSALVGYAECPEESYERKGDDDDGESRGGNERHTGGFRVRSPRF
jgi:hypothetical protein